MEDSLARAAMALLLIGGFLGAVSLTAAAMRLRIRSHAKEIAKHADIVPGIPTLLYFWTNECAQCPGQEREIQKAVHSIDASGRRLAVKAVNALENETLARSMSVMTVPTTILFDAQGSVAAWNAGLTTARDQLIVA